MKWDELYFNGISVENIPRYSDEYDAMFHAAVNGIASAEYYFGLWMLTVNKKPDVALIWLRRAAAKDYYEAFEIIHKLEGKSDSEDKITNKQTTYLDISTHDFQEAKNSLKKYTEQAQKDFELSRVPYEGGLFNLGDHKVTGTELNRITSQIQDYLVGINTLNQGLIEEFGQVYKAFEFLDKDYISGIIASIKSAEAVSIQEQKDRQDIKELVNQHEQSVNVLKKFKADIDKLKHLTDIDTVWELLDKQTKLTKEFSGYMSELSRVKHLKDIDKVYFYSK